MNHWWYGYQFGIQAKDREFSISRPTPHVTTKHVILLNGNTFAYCVQ